VDLPGTVHGGPDHTADPAPPTFVSPPETTAYRGGRRSLPHVPRGPPEARGVSRRPAVHRRLRRQQGGAEGLAPLLPADGVKDVVVLVSDATPEDSIAYLREREYPFIRCGTERVDLRAALDELEERFGVTRVATDSGGGLSGALIKAGVADEVSLVVTPTKRGGGVHLR
jgi:hypothetical protein